MFRRIAPITLALALFMPAAASAKTHGPSKAQVRSTKRSFRSLSRSPRVGARVKAAFSGAKKRAKLGLKTAGTTLLGIGSAASGLHAAGTTLLYSYLAKTFLGSAALGVGVAVQSPEVVIPAVAAAAGGVITAKAIKHIRGKRHEARSEAVQLGRKLLRE